MIGTQFCKYRIGYRYFNWRKTIRSVCKSDLKPQNDETYFFFCFNFPKSKELPEICCCDDSIINFLPFTVTFDDLSPSAVFTVCAKRWKRWRRALVSLPPASLDFLRSPAANWSGFLSASISANKDWHRSL